MVNLNKVFCVVGTKLFCAFRTQLNISKHKNFSSAIPYLQTSIKNNFVFCGALYKAYRISLFFQICLPKNVNYMLFTIKHIKKKKNEN